MVTYLDTIALIYMAVMTSTGENGVLNIPSKVQVIYKVVSDI